jgi:hypothetical protein
MSTGKKGCLRGVRRGDLQEAWSFLAALRSRAARILWDFGSLVTGAFLVRLRAGYYGLFIA